MPSLNRSVDRAVDLSRAVSHVLERRVRDAREAYLERIRVAWRDAQRTTRAPLTPLEAFRQWQDYSVDFVAPAGITSFTTTPAHPATVTVTSDGSATCNAVLNTVTQ